MKEATSKPRAGGTIGYGWRDTEQAEGILLVYLT